MQNTIGRTTDRRTVVGVFDDPKHAEMALDELRTAGFSPDQVSVVARDTGASREVVENTGMGDAASGAASGALLGGLTGGIVGWLVGIGALAIPGIGPVVAAGTLATTLGGAALGAAAGGLIGALVEAGVPEEDARTYEEHVKGGRILLTLQSTTDEQARQAYQIFDRHGGADVRGYGFDATNQATTADAAMFRGRAGTASGPTGMGVTGTTGRGTDEPPHRNPRPSTDR